MRFFGLMHIDTTASTQSLNLKTNSKASPIELYLKCASQLSRTLKLCNCRFTLLTNNKPQIASTLEAIGASATMELEEIKCDTVVPDHAAFHSAHFKLDAFKWIALNSSEYSALVDLDVIAIRDKPNSLQILEEREIPLYFDLTKQVTDAYGYASVAKDLEIVSGRSSEGRWCGGEFISGMPSFFTQLVDSIEEVYPKYLRNISELRHVGDEAYVSAALELLRTRGTLMSDAGSVGIVQRLWNARTRHAQPPLATFANCFLLHMPADKNFLASAELNRKHSLESIHRATMRHSRFSKNGLKRVSSKIL